MSEPLGGPAGAPWVRTRLRTAPTAALLTAALVFVTAFLAAALPRALDRGADQGLRELIRSHGPTAGSVLVTVPPDLVPTAGMTPDLVPTAGMTPDLVPKAGATLDDPEVRGGDLDRKAKAIAASVPAPLRLTADGPVYGSAARSPRDLLDGGLPSPGGLPPKLALTYLNDAASHARLVAGRWPSAAVTYPRY
ncbi:hypothetical protein, partial [Saccharothrix sp. ST-888]|uniref:hypothetical protein n=1 Tax=Saccharothrix sp. ST-888 TaxID=1427391 RepID=UPI0005EC90D3